MRKTCLLIVLCCAIGALTSNALAWNYTGHRLIATLAYDELKPAARARVDAILRAHPRYQADLIEQSPKGYDVKRFAFAMAGYWPDIVRDQSNPMHFVAHHPQWHYINVPVRFDGRQTAGDTKPAPAQSVGKTGEPQNVLEAIDKCRADLLDPNLPDDKKAVALCWLLHLVGDIHQPLHAATLYSDQFPEGDKGGNLFLISRNRYSQNLHALWDEALGSQSSPQIIDYIASGIARDPQLKRATLRDAKDLNPETWMRESTEVAKKIVYRNGELQGINSDTLKSQRDAQVPSLPDGYLTEAEITSLRRAALAGYRLGDLLNQVFVR